MAEPKKPEEESKSAEPAERSVINGLVTANEDPHTGTFLVGLGPNSVMSLADFLGLVMKYRGKQQSLGMAYNPSEGFNCMQICVYYTVTATSGFAQELKAIAEGGKK